MVDKVKILHDIKEKVFRKMINGKKVVGVVTEFNPFHDGHAYFLHEIRKKYAADYIVAVMSGDFVQRGEPAFLSKLERAKFALKRGVDLLVQLPVLFSLSGSLDFAYGSVKILSELGFNDQIVFGSECGDLERLRETATFLRNEEENPEYRAKFKEYLAEGDSYPKAREKALSLYYPGEILPNDNLGIAYLMAADILKSRMEFGVIQRNSAFSSAHAIRNEKREKAKNEISALQSGKKRDNVLISGKEESADGREAYGDMESLKEFLLYRILELEREGQSLSSFLDISADLEQRILKMIREGGALRGKESTVESFIQSLKGKNYTYSRVSRALLHVLLHIREEDMKQAKAEKSPYFRILGCSKRAEVLLSYLPENSIFRLGHSLRENSGLKDNYMMKIDLFGRKIYQAILLGTEEEYREFFLKI